MLSGTVDMTFRSLTVAGAAPDWSYRYDAPVSRFTLCRAPETRCVGEHGGGRGVNWDVGFGGFGFGGCVGGWVCFGVKGHDVFGWKLDLLKGIQ